MLTIKRYINKSINEMVDDMRCCELLGREEEIAWYEESIREHKVQLDVLDKIISDREGNLLRFDECGRFELWCVRLTDDGSEIIEHYEADMTFDNYEKMIEIAKCRDVTSEFDMSEVAMHTIVCDDIKEHIKHLVNIGGYCFVPEEAIRAISDE